MIGAFYSGSMPIDPQRSVAYLLHKGGMFVMAALEPALAAHGLTGRQYMVLAAIADRPLSQRALAGQAGIDTSVLVGVLDVLEERSLVRREADPDDRRRQRLSLTKLGASTFSAAAKASAAAEREFLGTLSRADQSVLSDLLAQVVVPHLAPRSPDL
jgi:DNA-binding MarR family transcriptional regulator